MGKLVVIVGGQYGSEAKGAVAAHLAKTTSNALMAVRVAGPNAGHTVYDNYNVEHKLRCIPVAAAVRPDAELRLAAGSEIDSKVLGHEIGELEAYGHRVKGRLLIDPQATRLERKHIHTEEKIALQNRIGSTAKGIGAARADRIMRSALVWTPDGLHGYRRQQPDNVADDIRSWLRRGGEVHIEGTQGYGLGLHAGEYPHCTSSDCRAIDFLAMAGISPWDPAVTEFEVWVVARTYPIRVAGNSGKLGRERTWDEMRVLTGRPDLVEERTTVTNKVRRIGDWDGRLVRQAVVANGGSPIVRVALMFADYLGAEWEGLQELENSAQREVINMYASAVGAQIWLVGTGPQSIIDLRWRNGQIAGQESFDVI